MKSPAKFFLISTLLLALFLTGTAAQADTSWNQTDENGLKQGWWKKYYPNGTVMYKGYFIDNKPSGKMTRYYDDGKLKAKLVHQGEITRASMFFRNGQLGARGKYIKQQRDSVWTYFSYYTGDLSYRETYERGKKDGPSTIYYPGGAVAEVIQFSNDIKDGKWEQYFEDSVLRLSSTYVEDRIHGSYRVYNRNKVLVLEGNYTNGSQDGLWKFYNEEGKLDRKFRFNMGQVADQKAYDEWMMEFTKEAEENMGKIPEPDFDNFFENQ